MATERPRDSDPVAETERLRLRHLKSGDLDEIHGLYSDPEVMRFSLGGPMSRERAAQWLQGVLDSYETNGWGRYWVEERAGGRFLGVCGFLLWEDVGGRREVEIGYRFLAETWGLGYATEAAIACRELGFGRFGHRRLISLIEPANIGSWKVAEKVCMRHEMDTTLNKVAVRVYSIER